ncbi:MAG: hypothetical protein ACQEV7_03090 [Bacillota bacterium]
MRDYTLQIQALNENKKLHQFKAYETLNSSFIQKYLSTYPEQISVEKVEGAARISKELFTEKVGESEIYTIDQELSLLLEGVSFSS